MAQPIALQDEELPDNCLVFKHSTRCNVSETAAEAVRAATFTLPLYWVNVIEQRALSDWIERFYGVRHESPQLLLIKNGRVDSSWTHFAIPKVLSTGELATR